MKKLIKKERKELIVKHKLERDGRIKDRIKAILLYDKERPISEIAECLFLSCSTIDRYIKEYFKNERLIPLNKGTESKLSKNQARRVIYSYRKPHIYESRRNSKLYVTSRI